MRPPEPQPTLARHIGLFALIVYGVGDMVGSGIYATVGDAAGLMGNAVWLGFVVSMVAALLTGLSYACLASRYPRAAGAAYVAQRAYRLPFLSYLIGLAVAASGLTSMAAAANAFARAAVFFLPAGGHIAIIVVFLVALAAVSFIGIRESALANLVCTCVEVGGLIFIIAVGARFWGSVDYLATPRGDLPRLGLMAGGGMLLSDAVLTFFSFVGFEDMLNVAEEVKDPQRTMPRGLIIALGIVTLLYIAVSVTAVSVVDFRALGNKELGPALTQITRRASPWLPAWVFTAITLFAVANTALINYIMGSRLLYGMARQGLVPRALARVHPRRRTPHFAIGVLLVLVLILAFAGNVSQLASATALLLLGSFAVINAALAVLRLRRNEPRGSFEVPIVVPVLGAIVCVTLIVARIVSASTVEQRRAPLIAGAIGAGIAVLYGVMKPRRVEAQEPPAHP